MRLRTIALIAVASTAGLGLVSAGAHATFTGSGTAGGVISVGAVDVQLSAAVAGATVTGNGQDMAGSALTLTFPALAPTGSSTGSSSTTSSAASTTSTATSDPPTTATAPASQVATTSGTATTGTTGTGASDPPTTITTPASQVVSTSGTATTGTATSGTTILTTPASEPATSPGTTTDAPTADPPSGGSNPAPTVVPTATAVPSTAPTSFSTGDAMVVITNEGTLAVSGVTVTPGDTYDSTGAAAGASSVMAGEVYLCEVSAGTVVYNGPLSTAPTQVVPGSLAPGSSDSCTVNVYAGSEPTACGAVSTPGTAAPAADETSPGPVLEADAMGGVIEPTFTVTYSG